MGTRLQSTLRTADLFLPWHSVLEIVQYDVMDVEHEVVGVCGSRVGLLCQRVAHQFCTEIND